MKSRLTGAVVAGLAALALVSCGGSGPEPAPTRTEGDASPTATEDTRPPIEQIIGINLKMHRDVLPEGVEQPASWGAVAFNPDGTVTGDESLLYISNPTHWQRDDDLFKLCTEEACEYWSEWYVRKPEPVDGQLPTFELVFAGAKDEAGNKIIRVLQVIE